MTTRFKRYTALLSFAAILLCGCQSGKGSPVIVRRKAETEAVPAKAEEGMNIAEQVQIPERYTMKLYGSGVLEVEADADIIIPDVQGFKLKKVEGRVFTQEDVDRQVEVLLKGSRLTQRIYKEGDPGEGYTKEELATIIESYENRAVENKDSGLEDEIEGLLKLYEEAPETSTTEVVEPVLGYEPELFGADVDKDVNTLTGNAVVDGEDYDYTITNYWSDDSKWIQNWLLRMDLAYPYVSLYGSERMKVPANVDKLQEKADKLVHDLGFMDMAAYGGEYLESVQRGTGEMVHTYGFHYTRMIDGIPITYTMESGSASQQAAEVEMASEETAAVSEYSEMEYLLVWPYEKLTVVYDDKGLAYFGWENPYEISDISDEYVFLLPFSDIKTIFERVILSGNQDYSGEYYDHVNYKIYEVRLGYARVMEKGNPGTGTLVPVWDFFGTRTTTYHAYEEGGDPETYVESVQYESLMTINAMDGSVIDRSYGY